MKTIHKFEREGDELVEIITGDELVDNKNNKVDGRFERKTYYPEKTAKKMVRELEKQLSEAKIGVEAREKKIKENLKDKKTVDKIFMSKLKAAINLMEIEKLREANKNEREKIIQLEEQIEKIRAVWPGIFT